MWKGHLLLERISSFINSSQKLNKLPEKGASIRHAERTMYQTARFFSKSLAIAQNGSVAAFFFFPLIQFTDSVKNSTFGLLERTLSRHLHRNSFMPRNLFLSAFPGPFCKKKALLFPENFY